LASYNDDSSSCGGDFSLFRGSRDWVGESGIKIDGRHNAAPQYVGQSVGMDNDFGYSSLLIADIVVSGEVDLRFFRCSQQRFGVASEVKRSV